MALAAELTMHPGAIVLAQAGVNCTDQGSQPGSCIFVDSTPAVAERGIAQFGVSTSQGGGAQNILGRTADGSWLFWFGTQNVIYQELDLPGPLIVCAGGDGLNVRSDPSADSAVVTMLADGTQMTAERFVLTEPGDLSNPLRPVNGRGGWYQISDPVQGWVYSRYISRASLGNCMLHDLLTAGG